MAEKGILTVVSGFSGSGKGTIMKALIEKYPSEYSLSISATTRSPRPGEENGREYFFKTVDEFKEMIENDQLLEHACYVGNYYGTPKAYVEEQLAANKSVILEIEIQGALNIREKFPDTVLLFVTPPSAEILRERLIGRGTETIDVVNSRLARAVEEADGCEAYDYLIINDKLEDAVEAVHQTILMEKRRMSRKIDLIEAIRNDLLAYGKGDK